MGTAWRSTTVAETERAAVASKAIRIVLSIVADAELLWDSIGWSGAQRSGGVAEAAWIDDLFCP